MRGRELLDTIENLNPAYIEAAAEKPKAKKAGWLKWGAMAACFCLVVALAPALFRYGNELKELEQSELFVYEGIQYYIIGNDDSPERYGFPTKITEEHTGEQIAFLTRNTTGDLTTTTKETQAVLFEYISAPCDAARILQYGDQWYPVVFAGVVSDDVEHLNGVALLDMKELYHIYGIDSPKDIIRIQITDAVAKAKVLYSEDEEYIEAFYSASVGLNSYSLDDYEQCMFGDCKTNEDIENMNESIRNDFHLLQITTKGELVLHLQIYPTLGWMRSINGNANYQINDALLHWYDNRP